MTQRTSPLRIGRKVAVVATEGVEEIELNTVLHEFRSRGAQGDLIAVTRGKRATGWWSIKPDLENAGATFIDEPAITGRQERYRARRLIGQRSSTRSMSCS
jgi:putative intracellular protease/amidase